MSISRAHRAIVLLPLLAALTGCQGVNLAGLDLGTMFGASAKAKLPPQNGPAPQPYAPGDGVPQPGAAMGVANPTSPAAAIDQGPPSPLIGQPLTANDVISTDGAGTLNLYQGMDGEVKIDGEYLLKLGKAKLGEDGVLRILAATGLTADQIAEHVNKGTVADILPVGGMEIAAKLLSSGEGIAVAHDLAKNPLMTTRSDAKGKFHLDIPPELIENVMVTAKVPDAIDPRLVYELFTRVGGVRKDIDEESDVLAGYMRTSLASRMDRVLSEPGALGGREAIFAPQFAAVLTQSVRGDIAAKATEALMAVVPLDDARAAFAGADEGAVQAVQDVFRQIRGAAARKMKEDPAFFARAAFVLEASARKLLPEGYEVKRGADLGDFLFRAYMSRGDVPWDQVKAVVQDLGVEPAQIDRLAGAALSLSQTTQRTLDANPEARAKIMRAVGGVLGPAVMSAGMTMPSSFEGR